MKKAIQMVMMVVCMCGNLMAAGFPPVVVDTADINPLNVARAFALKTPDHYQCFMSCEMLISNKLQYTDMTLNIRESDGGITSMSINGVVIPLPEPIYGIPLGDGKMMRNVYLHVNAMTSDDEYAGSGYVQKQEVLQGDNLVVVISPATIPQKIPFDVSKYGTDIQIVIDDFPYAFGWGIQNGEIYVYLPPVGGTYSYTIRRSGDGMVIGSGVLEPFQKPITSNDAYVGISYVGNVVGLKFPEPSGADSWVDLENVVFDCSIPTEDGSTIMGKVIFVDVGSGGLEISLNGKFAVYVQSASYDEGDMPYFELEHHDYSYPEYGWYYTVVNTTVMNAGKAVITIIPKTTVPQKVYMNLHRFYGTPSGGGGKG